MYNLTVEESFDAAHWLRDYEGPCARLHGHHWTVRVCISGDELSPSGLLIDFLDIKKMLRDALEGLDHRCINEVPPFDSISPTSENLARFLYEAIAGALGEAAPGLTLHELTVSESPHTSVTYRPGAG